jgi:hypothetical protein
VIRRLFNVLAAVSLVLGLALLPASALGLMLPFGHVYLVIHSPLVRLVILDRKDPTVIARNMAMPFSLLLLLLLILPTCRAYVYLRRQWLLRRIARGHCSKCGYDLRATPDRCPECGTLAQRENTDVAGVPKTSKSAEISN